MSRFKFQIYQIQCFIAQSEEQFSITYLVWDLKFQIKMKLFQISQKYFSLLGYSFDQHWLNKKSLIACINFWLGSFLSCLYILLEANSFWEYTNSLYITSLSITISVCFQIGIVQIMKMWHVIDSAEQLISMSKILN